MVIEVNFDVTQFRYWLLLLGGSISVLAWLTRDEHWAKIRFRSGPKRDWNDAGDSSVQAGGMRRGMAMLIGFVLLAWALAGPWLADKLGISFQRM